MRNTAKPIATYAQAVADLQASISKFQTAKESLKQASESLAFIAEHQGAVVGSWTNAEKKIGELLPGKFQDDMTNRLEEVHTATQQLQVETVSMRQAAELTTSTLLQVHTEAARQLAAINKQRQVDYNKIADEFRLSSQENSRQVTQQLRESVLDLTKSVADLANELKTSGFAESLSSFMASLDQGSVEVATTAQKMSSTVEDASLIVAELRSASATTPRYVIYMLAVQAVIVLLLCLLLVS